VSDLIPNIVSLDKGLDLQSPKIIAPPGSILDMLNYEQVDFQGQKRIDGFTRYDGKPVAAFDSYILVNSPNYYPDSGFDVVTNDGIPYGVMFDEYHPSGYAAVAVFNEAAVPVGYMDGAAYDDEETYNNNIIKWNASLRSVVDELPGPVSGLHWFKDRLYAVSDIGNYSPDDYRIDTDNKASLFESKTIDIADREGGDVGWNFVHHGWILRFEEGNVPSGRLNAKNQNRENVGIQGPTPTTDRDGSAQQLAQNIAIANAPPQVNGWKTSTSPSVYNLESSALVDDDGVFIYADAYFSWDGETGVISAPGIDGEDLIEYSPTNNVEVEI
jgi:hypothetical protein